MKTCAIDNCKRERVPGTLYCRDHFAGLWRNDPEVVEPRTRPEWVRRMETQGLPAKDYSTRSAA